MEVFVGTEGRSVGPVEANDIEVLVLNPNPADKFCFAAVSFRLHIKNKTANLTEKFPPHVDKVVVGAVEIFVIDQNHVGKTGGQKFNEEDRFQHLLGLCSQAGNGKKRVVLDATL